jgi:hypothetical protein
MTMANRIIPVTGSLAATYLRVQSIMHFPDDMASQDAMVSSVAAEAIRQSPSGVFEPSKFLENSLDAGISDGGHFAGQIFLFLIRMMKHRPKQASIAKAQYITMRAFDSKHDRTVKAHWAKYRTCSHLHAAWHLAHEVYGLKFGADEPQTRQSMAWLFNVADHMLREALAFDAQKLGDGWWCFPEIWPRPPADFQIPDLTDKQVEILKGYKAPTRAK